MKGQEHEKLSILSDEGGIFDILAGHYNVTKNAMIDIFLKAFSMISFKQDRIGRGSIHIEATLSSIGLMVQPHVIEALGRNDKFRGRGLIARFVFFVPSTMIGNRLPEGAPLDLRYVGHYDEMITRHLDSPWNRDETGRIIPYPLELSEGAYELYKEHFSSIEARMRHGGPLEEMKDIGGKSPGMAIKFAGLFHVSGVLTFCPDEFEISEETMHNAIVLNEFALTKGGIALGVMHMNQDTKNAIKVWSWIRNQGLSFFTREKCGQSMKSRLRYRQVLDRALGVLIERNYIRELHGPGGGKMGKGYEVNPLALKMDN